MAGLEDLVAVAARFAGDVDLDSVDLSRLTGVLEFLPPERVLQTRRRWGEGRWAA